MKRIWIFCALAPLLLAGCGGDGGGAQTGVSADMRAVMQQPKYAGATWGLRVLDAKTGEVLVNSGPDKQLFIGSVRKLFTIGELLDQVGPEHRYDTPVYAQGTRAGGVLDGNLVLVASGDLTMGGRTNPDGSIAVTDEDHNEADSLGNAVLSKPDPLAGYRALAQQVAAAGITHVTGDVAVDTRLFQPFPFRGQFDLLPIFVNDDLVDLSIDPAAPGQPAAVASRPVSAALTVDHAGLITGGAGSAFAFTLDPEYSTCIGQPGCATAVSGTIPVDYQPPFTSRFPLVQAIRITRPDNYARSVFIEALQAAGVTVAAPVTEENPVQFLPAQGGYAAADKVAELSGMPYRDYVKLILKVSYNIGADTSLLLWGKTQGVDNMDAALAAEKTNLAQNYGIAADGYQFFDGSGGGDATASLSVVTRFLARMQKSVNYAVYFDGLPALGTDGSLAFVTDYTQDPTLQGATGAVRAKTGTYAVGASSGDGLLLKGQAFGGYIHARSGRDLIYTLVVNDVSVADVTAIGDVFQDEGTLSAMLWRDY